MELLVVMVAFIGLALAARASGADSRPRFDDEPHRAI